MNERDLIAYGFLAAIVLFLTAVWHFKTRHVRGERRAWRRFDRARRRRRAEAIEAGEA
jgi:hypothetical protein